MSLPITQIGSIPHVESGNTLQIRRRFNQTVSAVNQVIAQSSPSPSGFSGTITTAALTSGGTQGSMVFQNGMLVSEVPAT